LIFGGYGVYNSWIMDTRSVHIKTFGCQMNKLDSSLLASAMTDAGFTLTEKVGDAAIIVINTCSVREHAEARVFSHLGHLKHLKKSRPGLIVAVMGCMAQRLGPELLEHPVVNIVCGPGQLPQLPSLIEQARAASRNDAELLAVTDNIRGKTSDEDAGSLDDFERLHDIEDTSVPGQAYVRAMRGCDRFCSYCVVPYVRGPEVSRPPQAIRDQIVRLADQGITQITLLGQTVNSYTYIEGDRTWRLADLLEMAAAIDGVHWVRFITSYPSDFDEAIFHAMARIDKVCPYLHIPAQSGSDRILKAMNRKYTAAEYIALLDKARDIVSDIAIAGDFIVGFPEETEEDFEATCDLLTRAQYKNAFIFKYSPRPGTRADKTLADDVPAEVKKHRNTRLLELQNSVSMEYNKRFIGKIMEVMVEGPGKKPHLDGPRHDLPQLVGRTATDYIVIFDGPLQLAGTFAKVRITRTSALTLFGQYVPE
jgi:tRNA-2-methylthio-N6-dimethylallyladenosine synthase